MSNRYRWLILATFFLSCVSPSTAQVTVGEQVAFLDLIDGGAAGDPLGELGFGLTEDGASLTGSVTLNGLAQNNFGALYITTIFLSFETGPDVTPITADVTGDFRVTNTGATTPTDWASQVIANLQVLEQDTFDFDNPTFDDFGDFVGLAGAAPTLLFGADDQVFATSHPPAELILPANGSYVGVLQLQFTLNVVSLDASDPDPTTTLDARPLFGFDGFQLTLDGATVVPEPASLALLGLSAGLIGMRGGRRGLTPGRG